MLWAVGCDLSCKLRTDGTHSCYQHDLSGYVCKNVLHIRLYGVAAQQVFNLNGLHLADGYLSCIQLIHSRKVHQLAGGFIADPEDFSLILRSGAWKRNVYFLNFEFIHRLHNAVSSAKNGHIIDVSVPFILIIIDKTVNLLIDLFCISDVAQDHLACVSCADQHNSLFDPGIILFRS